MVAQGREDRSWTRRRRGQEAASVRVKGVAVEGRRESATLGRGKRLPSSLRETTGRLLGTAASTGLGAGDKHEGKATVACTSCRVTGVSARGRPAARGGR